MILCGFLISVIIISIYLVKYNSNLCFLNKFLKGNIFKFLLIIIYTVIGILLINSYYDKFGHKEINDKLYFEVDNSIRKENKYYNQYMRKKYNNQKYDMPYIPDGFSYVEGEWNTGYIIQDNEENQYVWIPCTNKDIENVVKLQRKDFAQNAFIKYYECNNISYMNFIISSLENGGFYISRYEIGIENENPVSKKQVSILKGVTQDEAKNICEKMYNNRTDIHCELINGYAYDTTLEWLQKTNEIKHYIITGDEILTGRNCYNNLYDFTDNVLEFSLERNYDTSIIRGFSADVMEVFEKPWSDESRYAILMQSKELVSTNDKITVRAVLYK